MRPVANKPVHIAADYPARDGGMARSVQIDVTHVAAYYEYDPRCRPYAEENLWPRWMNGSQYLPNPPRNEDEYFNWMSTFQLPKQLKLTAERAAGPLAESMEHLSQRVVQRDLVSGRIDRYKLPEVGKAAAVGQYRDESVRPYRRTEYRDAYTPTVAIVSAIPTMYTTGGDDYCPRLVMLTLSVLWACESAGIIAQAAMVQGRTGRKGFLNSLLPDGYQDVVQGFMLTSSENVIPARAYGIFLNDDLWMHMKVGVKPCRYDYASVIAAMDRRTVQQGTLLNRFATENGGNAVHWAREVLSADIVIAIGDIADRRNAEVYLDEDFTIEQAIQLIADKATKL